MLEVVEKGDDERAAGVSMRRRHRGGRCYEALEELDFVQRRICGAGSMILRLESQFILRCR